MRVVVPFDASAFFSEGDIYRLQKLEIPLDWVIEETLAMWPIDTPSNYDHYRWDAIVADIHELYVTSNDPFKDYLLKEYADQYVDVIDRLTSYLKQYVGSLPITFGKEVRVERARTLAQYRSQPTLFSRDIAPVAEPVELAMVVLERFLPQSLVLRFVLTDEDFAYDEGSLKYCPKVLETHVHPPEDVLRHWLQH